MGFLHKYCIEGKSNEKITQIIMISILKCLKLLELSFFLKNFELITVLSFVKILAITSNFHPSLTIAATLGDDN